MKAFFLTILIFILLADPALGFRMTFIWDPIKQDEVVGVRIYYGLSGNKYKNFINVKDFPKWRNPSCAVYDPKKADCSEYTIDGFELGKTYYVSAVVYDKENNKSGYSAQATLNKKCINGHPDFCRDCGTCVAGQGDCDTSIECASGLECVEDVGEKYGFPWNIDVCEGQAKPTLVSPKNFRMLEKTKLRSGAP